MTQEEKQLLLADLCARLPYGVMCNIGLKYPLQLQRIFVDRLDGILLDFYEDGNDYQVYLSEVKPYLRPMSSMTEEEKEELKDICTMYDCDMGSDYECFGIKIFNISRYGTEFESNYVAIDWLNKKMFDYRGLIPMGLALEATEGMYNTKTE
jgi:hypothetical protein